MTSWPASLPLPLLDHGGAPRPATLFSPLENARIQRRNRFQAAVIGLSARWVFDLTQYDIWEDFFTTTIDNGASQFQIELRHPKNSELTLWVCRIIGGCSATYQDGNWEVQAELELIQAPLAEASPLLGWTPFYVDNDGNDANDSPFVGADDLLFCVKL